MADEKCPVCGWALREIANEPTDHGACVLAFIQSNQSAQERMDALFAEKNAAQARVASLEAALRTAHNEVVERCAKVVRELRQRWDGAIGIGALIQAEQAIFALTRAPEEPVG